MKFNRKSEKYSENINQSDSMLWCPKNNCRAHLSTWLTALITRYPISKGLKDTITWKTLFRKKPTILSKLDLSEAIAWQLLKSLSLRLQTLKEALREKCPYLELFWSAFSRMRTEYGEIIHTAIPNHELCLDRHFILLRKHLR